MTTTSIEWTDVTWNPVRGCSRVSEGCRNCYAIREAHRHDHPGGAYEGLTRISSRMIGFGVDWTGRVELIPSKLDEPLHWRKPRRVFVNSMSDLFHESLPFEVIAEVYGIMAVTLRHTFQVLTKRPKRRLEFSAWRAANRETADSLSFNAALACEWPQWPLPNVWEGVSIEDQATADERIPFLVQTPAALRWVSYEPALGPVDFRPCLHGYCPTCALWTNDRDGEACPRCGARDEHSARIDWLIVGGESGPGARPFDPAWARSTVRQCREARVACFAKQMGRWILGDDTGFSANHYLLPDGCGFVPPMIGPSAFKRPAGAIGFSLSDAKGGDPAEWPEDLRVREFPA